MEYLSNYTAFQSIDPDQIETVVAGYTTPFKMDLKGKSAGFNARVNITKVHKLDLAHSTFGDPHIDWSSNGDNDDYYLFFIPTDGGGEVSHQKQKWEFSEKTGLIWDMGQKVSAFQKNFHSFSLTLSKEKLANHARALGGPQCAMSGVTLDPMADLSSPGGLLFRNTVQTVAAALDGPFGEVNNELVMSQFSDLILTQLLTQFSPSTQQELSGHSSSYILPKHIKRARDYIHGHISEKLDMAILSNVADCSYRTLQRGFMSAFGITPVQYIRKVRLKLVHDEIIQAQTDVTVSSIARKWGFAHMGRFANEFYKEFGYYPKDHRQK